MNAGQTPLEGQWMFQVADAARRTGIDQITGANLCEKLARPLGGRQPEAGHAITACYDLQHACPLPEYARIYTSLTTELAELGLALG